MRLSESSWRSVAALAIALASLSLAGCSRQGGVPTIETTAAADQHLPFEATSGGGGISPTGALLPTAIPAGTPIAVHVRTGLSSATSRSGDAFDAVLDEPIMVRGQMVAPRGAILTGKVLDARASGEFEDAGYMRLGLTAISLAGKVFPIRTSSIFVKRGLHERHDAKVAGQAAPGQAVLNQAVLNQSATSQKPAGGSAASRKGTLIGASGTASRPAVTSAPERQDVGVNPERHLTFRLAQPLPLGM